MKKKFLILYLVVCIFTTTFVTQVNKAHAFIQFGIPAAGVGAYSGGALLLGGLLTYVGLEEYGDDIARHGEKVFNRLSSTTKDLLNKALGGAAITTTSFDASEFLLSIKDFEKKAVTETITEINSFVSQKTYEKNAEVTQEDLGKKTKYKNVAKTLSTSGGSGSGYVAKYRLFDFSTLGLSLAIYSDSYNQIQYYGKVYFEGTTEGSRSGSTACKETGRICITWNNKILLEKNLGTNGAVAAALTSITTVEELLEFFLDELKIVKTDEIVNIQTKSQTMTNTVMDNVDEIIAKGGTIHFPKADAWTGIDAVGNNVGWNLETGTYTTNDGVPAVLPVNPSIPYPKVVDGVIAAPVGDGTYVDVGTGTIVGSPSVPGVGEGGILQGLWDFLKNILQSILDALNGLWQWIKDILAALLDILAKLAAMLGIIALIDAISSTLSNIYDWIKKTPDDKPSFWKPWTLLLPFLNFLFAGINFVIKLGMFLAHIPLVPEKNLPDPYGKMFITLKDYKVGNLTPYNLMITLATTLFGFTIYRILRRVFNG